MVPEEINGATLYFGDVREYIDGLAHYDSIVTDPPYGIEEMVGGYGRAGETISNDKDLSVCHEVLNRLWERPCAKWMVAFYSARLTYQFLSGMPNGEYYGDVVWDKVLPGMGRGIRYQHENASVFRRDGTVPSETIFSVIRQPRVCDSHPHEKPTGLMVKLCQLTSGVVIDPFMGSGSTGAACVRLGRRFIGFEVDRKHFDSACRKIEAEASTGDMFYQQGVQEDLL